MEERDPRLDDDLVVRLRALVAPPVPAELASRHLSAMAAVRPVAAATPVPARTYVEVRERWRRVRLAAAAVAAVLMGSTGLAAAGALPDPAQRLAHDAFGVVGLNVPDEPARAPQP